MRGRVSRLEQTGVVLSRSATHRQQIIEGALAYGITHPTLNLYLYFFSIMQPIQASDLKAFLLALSQLDAPLPDDVQAEVNTITIPEDIRKLDAIASSYPPLATAYNQVWDNLDAIAKVRSKGVDSIPEYSPESLNTEIDNSSINVEAALAKLDQKADDNTLAKLSSEIFQALNSVKTAKEVIQTFLSQ